MNLAVESMNRAVERADLAERVILALERVDLAVEENYEEAILAPESEVSVQLVTHLRRGA